jgi:subtilisin family serine protease
MKRRLQTIVLIVTAMSRGLALGAEERIPVPCQRESLSYEEMVLCGLATPQDLILRVPELLDADRFVDPFKIDKTKFEDIRKISDHLYAVRLSTHGLSFLDQARQLGDKLRALNQPIRMKPKIEIPKPLDEILKPEDIKVVPGALAAFADEVTSRAEPNLILYALKTPTDKEFVKQCGLKAINAEKAWDLRTTAPHVKVAIVDSGVVKKHDDLMTNAKPLTDDDIDENGHGTHLAGIIGAVSDGSLGVVGVAWETDIVAYRFLDRSGKGTLENALREIDLAIAKDARIILLAWGVGTSSDELEKKISDAKDKVLFVAAAGNNAQDMDKVETDKKGKVYHHKVYPAAYQLDNLISVMATTCDDVRAPFSNYGMTTVDLAAPGEGLRRDTRIYSTVLNQHWGPLAGTSMAAAFVAGAAALVLEGTPSAKPAQVKCWLNFTVTPLDSLAGKNRSGGRLDLAAAVQPLDSAKCP